MAQAILSQSGALGLPAPGRGHGLVRRTGISAHGRAGLAPVMGLLEQLRLVEDSNFQDADSERPKDDAKTFRSGRTSGMRCSVGRASSCHALPVRGCFAEAVGWAFGCTGKLLDMR